MDKYYVVSPTTNKGNLSSYVPNSLAPTNYARGLLRLTYIYIVKS